MKKDKPVVVGIGELLWDILPSGRTVGGAPVNFVYHAVQAGAEGPAVTAVGNDIPGTEILHELDKKNIRYLAARNAHPTGIVRVTLNQGSPSYSITEKVAWDYLELSAATIDLAERADALCFGTLAQRSPVSRETIRTLMSFGSEEAYRIFDMNICSRYYSREIVEDSLKLSNVVKMNAAEAALLCGLLGIEEAEEDIAQWLLYRYAIRMVIVTAGSSHSTVYTKDGFSRFPAPAVTVADEVGAGDAFPVPLSPDCCWVTVWPGHTGQRSERPHSYAPGPAPGRNTNPTRLVEGQVPVTCLCCIKRVFLI